MSETLRTHDVRLAEGPLVLRPMTEDDWGILLPWNRDPQVLFYAEDDDVQGYTLEEMRDIYRTTSRRAYVFVIELDGRPIGDCWLQEMNRNSILARHPGSMDLRRIDLVIGAKELWGRGWGTKVIGMLTRFGFEECGADAIFGLVSDHNPRSRRAFEKNGYVVERVVPQPAGGKVKESYDLVLTRDAFV
ncbi:MAG: GNAT family N-acetyltransferase [Planctomycetota bacterium]|jgi:RimJ/RimL family protein N-acetyltransferase